MTDRAATPSLQTVDKQHAAARPDASAWVNANAGSGKTHVLTQRVLRLLLTGVKPESILCLTYTKAAAAEMRRRVAGRLGEWALMADGALDKDLKDLSGIVAGEAMRRRARTLFAHALETPGGLKINTIHAFCESVLHRFPLEARVPFDFQVIEEAEQKEMILAAREGVLAEGLRGHPDVAAAVELLFARQTDDQISKAIDAALVQGRHLRPVLAEREGAKANLRKKVGLPEGETGQGLIELAVKGTRLAPADYARVFALTPPGDGKRFEDVLARIDVTAPDAEALFSAFLTAEGTVPRRFPKKAIADADPGLAETLVAEAERLAALKLRITRAELVERSEALIDVLGAISDRFERQKRARSLLDFDDLVARLHALLANGEMKEWVRYKLDTGITHVLVDEGQDTNPEQWAVVEAIADEFFAGEGAIERTRTLFAVGDPKQSIYSFQGAEPEAFIGIGRTYARRAAEAGTPWNGVRLTQSFRTQKGILNAVDEVCANPQVAAALLSQDEPIVHETARTDAGGVVTLWPPVREPDNSVPEDEWPLEPRNGGKSAARTVAQGIARQIAEWVTAKRPLGARGRAVTADDVLVLVQDRSNLFHEIIRALKECHLPSPGADKLPVATHIAVLDLLALGDVLLNPADDLVLAALLRSPLFEIDEDQLYALCHERKGTVWAALDAAADRHGWARTAYDRLHGWRARLDLDRPYELYAQILYAEGGLRHFHARLGAEVDDVVAEFLNLALAHEQGAEPSLQAFLAETRRSAAEIRRELPEKGAGVRVMTVHGAKGLEAPIVILADAASAPGGQKLGQPVYLKGEAPEGPLLVFAPRKQDHAEQTLPLREAGEERQRQEYWRKLYVGMTRAEDELYITGTLTRKGKIEGTWYEAVAGALEAEAAIVSSPIDGEAGMVYPAARHAPAPLAVTPTGGSEAAVPGAPEVPAFEQVPTVNPSTAGEVADPEAVLATLAESVAADPELARKTGTALHAMLQHLAPLSVEDRRRVAPRAVLELLPDAPELHADLAQKAFSILERPEFAHLFSPDSRAEVPFAARAAREGEPVELSGRIDRLVVTETQVLIVDYKSDAVPPETPAQVPSAYLTQLGLYAALAERLFPHRSVKAAILWTAREILMELPAEQMAAMCAPFTLAQSS